MDFSSANTALWNPIIQIGIIAGLILLANVLRWKVPFYPQNNDTHRRFCRFSASRYKKYRLVRRP